MSCRICGSEKTTVINKGKIRNGAPGHMANEDVSIQRCESCSCFCHMTLIENPSLYQSNEYRESMGEKSAWMISTSNMMLK